MALKNIFNILVDLKIVRSINQPLVTQNDSVVFILEVMDNGVPFDLTDTTTMSLAHTRRDGTVVVTPGTKEGNIATFELGTNETAVAGGVIAKAQFYDAEGRVSTLSFGYTVGVDPTGSGYVPSEVEQTLIQVVMADAQAKIDELSAVDVVELSQQLAEKLNQGEVSVNDIDKNKGKLDQTYMSDTFLAQMAGTTAINAVPADQGITKEKIANNAVGVAETNFLQSAKTNLFNKDDVLTGQIVNYGNGTVSASANYTSTNFLRVKSSTPYKSSALIYNRAFYDETKTFISGDWPEVTTFTTPVNAKYVRFSILTTATPTLMFLEGATIPTEYIPFGKHVDVSFKNVEFADNAFDFLEAKKVSDGAVTVDSTTFFKKDVANLFNKATAQVGKALSLNGSIGDNVDYTTSDYMPIEPNTLYKAKGMSAKVFYGKNKNYLSGEGYIADFTTTSPNEAYFVRISYHKTEATLDNQMFVEGSVLPVPYLPYSDIQVVSLNNIKFSDSVLRASNSKLYNKKWNALGDSITNNPNGYHKMIADKTGAIVRNYGISSSTISTYGTWVNNPMVTRYVDMDNDADIVTVFGGVNDAGDMVPIGTINSTDVGTFMGAYNVLLSGLVTKYPTKLIATFTPLQTDDSPGRRTKEMAQAVKDVSAKHGIPCLDLFTLGGLTIENMTALTNDRLHPNDTGHAFIAGKILSFLEYHLPL